MTMFDCLKEAVHNEIFLIYSMNGFVILCISNL